MNPFSGRTAFVVGGSSGIGLAVAQELARQGASLCLLARRQELLEQAAAKVRALARRPQQRVLWACLDVIDADMTGQVMRQMAAEFSRPDLLINCAGRAQPCLISQLSPAQVADTLRLNLQGAMHVALAAWPLMGSGGQLVNVSSLAGLLGVYGYSDYCAAKFGLVGFSAALRAELAPLGIQVAVLCPGDTDTPGYRQEDLAKPALTRALSGHAGLLPPEQVAKALLAGLRRGQFLIVPGLKAKLIVAAQRLAPGLVWRVMWHQIQKASARLSSQESA